MSEVVLAGLSATRQQAASEQTVLAFLGGIRKFQSVVEFGCGSGSWLQAARLLGAQEIRGYDNQEMPAEARQLSTAEFVTADFARPIEMGKRFDLAICLDGASRVGAQSPGTLVRGLCAASAWVLFGASVPYSPDAGAAGGLWTEAWASLFREQDYLCYDILRRRFWHDTRVAFRYRQGTCLYVRAGAHYPLRARGYQSTDRPQSMIHPEMFLELVSTMTGSRDIGFRTRSFYRAAGRCPATPPAAPPSGAKITAPGPASSAGA